MYYGTAIQYWLYIVPVCMYVHVCMYVCMYVCIYVVNVCLCELSCFFSLNHTAQVASGYILSSLHPIEGSLDQNEKQANLASHLGFKLLHTQTVALQNKQTAECQALNWKGTIC